MIYGRGEMTKDAETPHFVPLFVAHLIVTIF